MKGSAIFSPGCEPQLFDSKSALAIAKARAFEPLRRFFSGNAQLLRGALVSRFRGYDEAALRAGPVSYGLHCSLAARRDVYFWFGVGWGADDPPELLPSWGAALEFDDVAAEAFWAGSGGLRAAAEALCDEHPELQIQRHDARHIELASWRDFDWLLEQDDQRLALERFWITFLDHLVRAGLAARLAPYRGEFAR